MNTNVMNQIPSNIMKPHDPNDDPFAALADDSTNQLTNPMEYGSGLSYFVQSDKKKAEEKEEHTETTATEESTSSTEEEDAAAADDSKPTEPDDKKGEADKEDEGKKEE